MHSCSWCAIWDPVVNDFARQLSFRYGTTLRRHLTCEDEAILQEAYELGRKAAAGGLGILDLARIHQEMLVNLIPGAGFRSSDRQTLKAAETFFFEILSPFEATQRGFQEANARMHQLITALEERNHELAQINAELGNEITERKRSEKALRESEANLRKISHKALHVQEEERTRISRELHDEVGQLLTAINVNLTMLKRDGNAQTVALQRRIRVAQKQLEHTMECVHRFARELRPAMLDDLGLLPALRAYTKSFEERTGIQTVLEASAGAEALHPEGKTVVFRVVQESLTNVAKHSHATRATISLRALTSRFRLEVKDNGRAFHVEKKTGQKQRLGLLGMQERVRLVTGTFLIQSRRGEGTTIQVEIPRLTRKTASSEVNTPMRRNPKRSTVPPDMTS
jgi:signal transduction histidine kinase